MMNLFIVTWFYIHLLPVEKPSVFFFFFKCHVAILMVRPHVLMNAGNKARIQLLLGQMGPLEKKKTLSLYCLLIFFKKMNMKWGSVQLAQCIIIDLLREVKNNETIFSHKARIE